MACGLAPAWSPTRPRVRWPRFAGVAAFAPPCALQTQGGLGNRLEHDEGDACLARSAEAVAPCRHPDQGQFDVGKGSSGTRRNDGIHLTQSRFRFWIHGVAAVGIGGPVIRPAVRVELSELFAAEPTLLLQLVTQSGKPGHQHVTFTVAGGTRSSHELTPVEVAAITSLLGADQHTPAPRRTTTTLSGNAVRQQGSVQPRSEGVDCRGPATSSSARGRVASTGVLASRVGAVWTWTVVSNSSSTPGPTPESTRVRRRLVAGGCATTPAGRRQRSGRAPR